MTLWLTRYPAFADAKKTIAPYQGWIQVALIASSAMLTMFILAKFGAWLANAIGGRRFQKAVHKHLMTLTSKEKEILQVYLLNETRTAEWPFDDSVVSALISRGLLYRGGAGDIRAFLTHVTEEVWLEINKHPELIL